MRKTIILLGCCLSLFSAFAGEGMWLPLLMKQLNHADMQRQGLKLSAEQIYSVNQASLKDAIVSLGGFCTGELISKEGLMLTNHHCAFDAIQEFSSTENDYLKDGFWAMSRDQELHVPDLTASILVRMEDVTAQVLAQVKAGMNAEERANAIALATRKLERLAVAGTTHNASIESFFRGNEYYLFVYQTFSDVRLTGAPPSSIGKFGGDTDNWMWPRHTGDFSLFRIYASPENQPAEFSIANQPFEPKHHLPISLNGVAKGDFAMIMGFPGSTDRFLTSHGIDQALRLDQPKRVELRQIRLQEMAKGMESHDSIRIQYAAKYASVSNYYKYYKGQQVGLKKLNVLERKRQEEQAFAAWVAADAKRLSTYGNVLTDLTTGYETLNGFALSDVYLEEGWFGIEANALIWTLIAEYDLLDALQGQTETLTTKREALLTEVQGFFKDYNQAIDQRIMASILTLYNKDIPADQQPAVFQAMQQKFKGDWGKFAAKAFAKSIFTDKARFLSFLDNPNAKKLAKDPILGLFFDYIQNYQSSTLSQSAIAEEKVNQARQQYIQGLREMQSDRVFYPDANSTLRVTYGQVKDYTPQDALQYHYFTTLRGIMQKENPEVDEFKVHPKLKALYEAKDYGQYGTNGVLNVCFLTDTDITGGNSGSPVINAEGALIGCAFDGNWEAMSGDIAFETQVQRTISVDIRYILFVIDKFAGATHLIDELTILPKHPPKPLPIDHIENYPSGEPIKSNTH